MAKLPDYVTVAIKCGPVPKIRNWQTLPRKKLTKGEKVLRFAKEYLVFPEGVAIGKPLELDAFQSAFILAAFDGDDKGAFIDKAILSMARRGGKTLVMAVICLAYVVGPFVRENTFIRSAAMTREQAGLLYRLMSLICTMSPRLEGKFRAIPSSKKIVGLSRNVEYQSLSRDAKSGHGQAIYVLVIDECGQIDAPNDDFLDMLFSSMGSYEDAKTFMISTQAPSDSAFFSVEIDTAEREQTPGVVSHVYTSDTDSVLDQKGWAQANPSLRGGYRSLTDIERRANDAHMIPAKANGFLNLYMNRRVSRESLWLAPAVWKANAGEPDWDVFRERGVYLGLDLSKRNDLSCAVISAKDDDGVVHMYPYTFTPEQGIDERSARDKVPYRSWADQEIITAVPGATIDYDWVCQFLGLEFEKEGIDVHSIEFDRWRIRELQAAAERSGFAQEAIWNEVGQGFKDMTVRVEAMETALLQTKIRHGAHPVFNLGAASAVIMSDPTGSRKLAKDKSSQKIDAIVAGVMSVYPLLGFLEDEAIDVMSMIG